MPSSEGKELAAIVRQKLTEMNRLCDGLDEATASRAPKGRWSPKEILSHLCGPKGVGPVNAVGAYLGQDTPKLDMEPANPFFTEERKQMTAADLLQELNRGYEEMAGVVEGLSDEQLARKAHIPMFKETPLGEYPTLAAFVRAMTEHHLTYHIDHMAEILGELGMTVKR